MTLRQVHLAKSHIRLHDIWSKSALRAFLIAKDAKSLYADNETADQNAQMRRLI